MATLRACLSVSSRVFGLNVVLASPKAAGVVAGAANGARLKSGPPAISKPPLPPKQAEKDKEMREKFGLLSHDDMIKDNTDVASLSLDIHTAKCWDEDDLRNTRFIDGKKFVVPKSRHAIELIAEVPPIACKSRVVACDGGDGPLGHPKVFINLDKPGNHDCGYCGLRFYLDHGGC